VIERWLNGGLKAFYISTKVGDQMCSGRLFCSGISKNVIICSGRSP